MKVYIHISYLKLQEIHKEAGEYEDMYTACTLTKLMYYAYPSAKYIFRMCHGRLQA